MMTDMLLSQTAEYALRAMATLASATGPLRADEVSEAAGIPSHYVSKVLRRLVEAGLLRSQKGHGGGFRLARPAREIRFREVIVAADGEMASGRCAFGWGQCNTREPCPLHPAFSRLNDSLEKWVDRTTLADVKQRPARKATR